MDTNKLREIIKSCNENGDSYKEQSLITDLVTELTMVLNDNATLEHRNFELKLDNQHLEQKLNTYQEVAKEEKNDLLATIHKHEKQLDEKDNYLKKLQKHIIEQHTEYQTQIQKLLNDYQNCQSKYENEEQEFKNKILNLQNEIAIAKIIYNKYIRYKNKLKYAVKVVSSSRLQNKAVLLNKECQTSTKWKKFGVSDLFLENQRDLEKENHILRELFFKEFSNNIM